MINTSYRAICIDGIIRTYLQIQTRIVGCLHKTDCCILFYIEPPLILWLKTQGVGICCRRRRRFLLETREVIPDAERSEARVSPVCLTSLGTVLAGSWPGLGWFLAGSWRIFRH